MIVERGEGAVDALPKGLRENPKAMAETIENNVRRLIVDEMAVNPKYYGKMSELLDALILQRKQEALDYKAYLTRIVALSKQVSQPGSQSSYPAKINTPALRALYENLEGTPATLARERREAYGGDGGATTREEKAVALDDAIPQREESGLAWQPIQGARSTQRDQAGARQ